MEWARADAEVLIWRAWNIGSGTNEPLPVLWTALVVEVVEVVEVVVVVVLVIVVVVVEVVVGSPVQLVSGFVSGCATGRSVVAEPVMKATVQLRVVQGG